MCEDDAPLYFQVRYNITKLFGFMSSIEQFTSTARTIIKP